MHKNKIIVALGGGEMGRTKVLEDGSVKEYPIETMPIDKEILKFSGTEAPKFLFVGTASRDKDVYFNNVKNHFEGRLNCQVSRLNIAEKDMSFDEIENIIMDSDIVYVGGGDTRFMLDRWRDLGVDKILMKAYDKGIVLSGLSAGAICWFDWVENFDDKGNEDYEPQLVKGLGFIKGIARPHYETVLSEDKEVTEELLADKQGPIYGLDNCAAIISENGELRFMSSKDGRKVEIVREK